MYPDLSLSNSSFVLVHCVEEKGDGWMDGWMDGYDRSMS